MLLDVVADVKMGVCNSVIMVLYLFLGLWRKSFLFISVE
ncbi:putative membrane protein [Anaplasma phagocytophilum str. ApWI1]|uniref:Putative membrane protein n=3 Tax=Anaplasma phagocytophilum TaxID=948 RepID=A0A0F3N464_ANAPH|nr:putative membrane protein [Anaplasma phagocytophilum str. Webster]KJV62883.1 putative membrane protein [Anaplasma phagocytophilum str. NCH-1]KJV67759.1 putative membrane protein [Anaplasma phagocytophilum str. ApNP]KJV82246.1 putative membrane protein [Anaplasma phagocytophilum str. HGE2]KJV85101.1 putative membrane protein [Anaplasma phagocytophilum str. ApWI1]KJV87251.1 putative membrane protein [Anaplasma phagocytophilum str. ApNYW]KJV98027.1 putative membrane protein [Anaplasma phagocy